MAPTGPNRVKLTKIFCHACFQCKIEFKSGFVFFNFTYRKSETQERQNDRKTDNKRERLNNKKMERERE